MPTVTIDARTLGETGLGMYARDLIENIGEAPGEFDFRVLCKRSADMNAAPAGRFRFVKAVSAMYSVREQWEVARLARGGNLLHSTHYNVPCLYRGRMVVTIHDISHLIFREFLPGRAALYYARFMLHRAAHRARRIITISEFSKRSICEHLGVREEKVRVILRVASRRFPRAVDGAATCRARLGAIEPYILFVGLLKRHKNVDGLLRAFASLPSQLRDSHRLVIAGKLDSYYPALKNLAAELGLGDRAIFTGHVSDDELHALYAGATAFALTSLNEGFGLPVLEAMTYGVPVIVSNTSSLPEVAGGAGILVDPSDDRSIARGIEQVITDRVLRESLGERSRARAKMFSAREFARQHLEVYREALSCV